MAASLVCRRRRSRLVWAVTLVREVTLLLTKHLRAADAIKHGLQRVLCYLLFELACAACNTAWARLCLVSTKCTLLC